MFIHVMWWSMFIDSKGRVCGVITLVLVVPWLSLRSLKETFEPARRLRTAR